MDKQDLEQLMETAVTVPRKVVEEGREVMPVWLVKAGHTVYTIASPWGDERGKAMTLTLLRALFEFIGVSAYVLISEVWIAEQAKDPEIAKLMPMQRSDRREAVYVLGITHGCRLAHVYPIVREVGRSYLDERDEMVPDKITGTMPEMLPPEGTPVAHPDDIERMLRTFSLVMDRIRLH